MLKITNVGCFFEKDTVVEPVFAKALQGQGNYTSIQNEEGYQKHQTTID